MTRKYSFETKSINGKEFVIAELDERNSEPVRVRADWVESDDLEGKWEQLIEQIIQPETINEINIADGDGGIRRDEAVEELAGTTVDGETIVSSEKQADVLVEYLANEGVLSIEGNTLVLFRDPEGEQLNGPALMNWAALMSAVIGSIDEHLERVKNAKEKFKETMDSLETERSDSNNRLSKTAQRLQNLGQGQGIPDPETLSDKERKQYDQLKSHYLYLRNIEKAKEKNLFETVDTGIDQMAMAIDELEAAREAYDIFYNNTRRAAVKNSVFPEEALDFVNNAGNLINDLAGTEATDEDEVDNTDLESMIEEDLGQKVQKQADSISNIADTASQAAGKTDMDI